VIARLKALGAFWYDFIIGDDWRIAVSVVIGLVATYLVSLTPVPAWWIVPAALVVFLPASVWRASRR
jgi:hypothetical protein